jgi:beta-phosphoglucomutase-like phosphatase (HAD superfamily)
MSRDASDYKTLELVIFDCDGVLVDSELITNRVFASMLDELGVQVTLEYMFEKFVGRSMAYCCDLVAGMLKGPIPDNFLEHYTITDMAELPRVWFDGGGPPGARSHALASNQRTSP